VIAHLARRFLANVAPAPLSAEEVGTLRRILSAPEAALFFAQDRRDQRHGYRSAATATELVAGTGPRHAEPVRAATLHDVGKTAAGLGLAGRVWAGLCLLCGPLLPRSRRVALYLDHGELGARLLEGVGSSPVVVA